MDKILVALLATLALAVPVTAQDGGSDPSDPASGEPAPQGNQTAPSNGTAPSNSTASAPEPVPEPTPSSRSSVAPANTSFAPGASEMVVRLPCPLVKSNVGDPSIPKSQWVMVDPDGCFQKVVYRILNWPPSPFRTS